MNLTLPIFDISKPSLINGKSELAKTVGKFRSELNCEGKLKIPIAPNIRKEFEVEETEVLKPPWRIPSLFG